MYEIHSASIFIFFSNRTKSEDTNIAIRVAHRRSWINPSCPFAFSLYFPSIPRWQDSLVRPELVISAWVFSADRTASLLGWWSCLSTVRPRKHLVSFSARVPRFAGLFRLHRFRLLSFACFSSERVQELVGGCCSICRDKISVKES